MSPLKEQLPYGGARWRCPECHTSDIQIALPVWFKEEGLVLEQIQIDEEADPIYWLCNGCEADGQGAPEAIEIVQPGESNG